jgi:N-acetylneuraminic acid mutarotase
MKYFYIFCFLLYSTAFFSQKVTLKVLDYDTNTAIEKAHIFFIHETIYSNEKGEFSFSLNKLKAVSFSVTHLNYETKKVVFEKGTSPKVVFLKEKQETLGGIEIYTKRSLKKTIGFKKLLGLPKAVYAFASVINDGKIYVFGGDTSSEYEKNKEGLSQVQFSNEREIMQFLQKPKPINFNNYLGVVQTYHISNKKWSVKKEKVVKRAYHKALIHKDTVLLIGGKMLTKKKSRELLSSQIEFVSLKDLSIKLDESNPHQAVNFGTAIYENKVLIFGGFTKKFENGRMKYSNKIHFLDLESGYWYLLTKMPKGKEVTGIVFENKLYLFGGYNQKSLTDVESFDLKTAEWKKEGTLFRGMRKPAITKDKEFIYLQEDGKIITFKPKTKVLKEYNIDIKLKGSEMHFSNGKLYIIGGFQVEDYRKAPSNGFYSVKVSEFFKTKPINNITF